MSQIDPANCETLSPLYTCALEAAEFLAYWFFVGVLSCHKTIVQ